MKNRAGKNDRKSENAEIEKSKSVQPKPAIDPESKAAEKDTLMELAHDMWTVLIPASDAMDPSDADDPPSLEDSPSEHSKSVRGIVRSELAPEKSLRKSRVPVFLLGEVLCPIAALVVKTDSIREKLDAPRDCARALKLAVELVRDDHRMPNMLNAEIEFVQSLDLDFDKTREPVYYMTCELLATNPDAAIRAMKKLGLSRILSTTEDDFWLNQFALQVVRRCADTSAVRKFLAVLDRTDSSDRARLCLVTQAIATRIDISTEALKSCVKPASRTKIRELFCLIASDHSRIKNVDLVYEFMRVAAVTKLELMEWSGYTIFPYVVRLLFGHYKVSRDDVLTEGIALPLLSRVLCNSDPRIGTWVLNLLEIDLDSTTRQDREKKIMRSVPKSGSAVASIVEGLVAQETLRRTMVNKKKSKCQIKTDAEVAMDKDANAHALEPPAKRLCKEDDHRPVVAELSKSKKRANAARSDHSKKSDDDRKRHKHHKKKHHHRKRATSGNDAAVDEDDECSKLAPSKKRSKKD